MNTAADSSPDQLRSAMVDAIVARTTLSTNVEAALRAVPRHRFLPAATPDEAYADIAVTTKPGTERPLSCASQPTIVAQMLEQLDVRPGHGVLEIGAGTGYNAALLAALTGPTGEVTTIDIYPDVVEQANQALQATGYDNVVALVGDGADGHAERGPYDRIIVTVGPWDIPPAWTDQLDSDGRIVVPLHWRGQAQSITFAKRGTHLVAESTLLCGFIPMVGLAMERSGNLDPAGNVIVACDEDQDIDLDALRGVLDSLAMTIRSGVNVGGEESLDRLWLRLTATDPATCRITAGRPAVDAGVCRPAIPSRSPALAEGASIAYLQLLRDENVSTRWELGVAAHGPAAKHLTDRFIQQIRAWGADRTRVPTIRAYPSATSPSVSPNGLLISRRHRKLVLSI